MLVCTNKWLNVVAMIPRVCIQNRPSLRHALTDCSHSYFIVVQEEPQLACGNSELVTRVKQLEIDAVDAAEKGNLATAERLFTEIIGLAPGRASSYNNRAQTRRLMDNVAGNYQCLHLWELIVDQMFIKFTLSNENNKLKISRVKWATCAVKQQINKLLLTKIGLMCR